MNQSESMNDGGDLAALLPGRDVTANGEIIKVLPLFFGQYPQAMKVIRPLVSALAGAKIFEARAGVDAAGNATSSFVAAADWMFKIPQIFEEGGEALMQFLAFAIGKKRDWFNTLPADEGLALTQAVLEENADFFRRRILPMLQAAKLVGPAAKDGDESLQGSSDTVTDGSTSNE